MSYSLQCNAHKSESDQLSATLTKEKADHDKSNAMVSSFSFKIKIRLILVKLGFYVVHNDIDVPCLTAVREDPCLNLTIGCLQLLYYNPVQAYLCQRKMPLSKQEVCARLFCNPSYRRLQYVLRCQ